MGVKFTPPLDDEADVKMKSISKYYGRSRVKEIEWACKEWIRRIEAENGKISREDLQALQGGTGE